MGNEITTVTLLDIVTNTSVYYDPDPKQTIIKADEELVRNFNDSSILDDNDMQGLSPWILRIEVDTAKLQGKHLSLQKIEQVLRDRIPSLENCSLNIIRNIDAENLDRAIIRLRLPEELTEDNLQKTYITLCTNAFFHNKDKTVRDENLDMDALTSQERDQVIYRLKKELEDLSAVADH